MKASQLSRFAPFKDLDWEALATVAQHARLLRLPAGRRLGQAGRPARGHYFLLQGTVRGADGRTLSHHDERARLPLISDGDITTQIATTGPAVVVWADLAPVAFLLHPEALGYRVGDLASLGGDDWLRTFLGDGVIAQLSPLELQALLRGFEPIDVGQAEEIVGCGEPGDAFYVISRGGVEISVAGGDVVELGVGGYFGEDALLTGGRRNASVRANEPSRLMALTRERFWSLVGDRVVRWVDEMDADRMPLNLAGIEAHRMRECCARAEPGNRYLVCGGSRGARALAVFLLARRGFDAVALDATGPVCRAANGSDDRTIIPPDCRPV
jgi:CRP-like cAMP-binding protein